MQVSKESQNQGRKPPDKSRGLDNFSCDVCSERSDLSRLRGRVCDVYDGLRLSNLR
ncbi:hypothetical protein [Nostoc foliaceum]|uniref:Uncharacterized protein n=1 Tax=Nostoc linckia FACHB-391 TaxID=2692906 RepID=A0ABR8F4Y1_NOSLI|nr:hypothetical protein [Nostoc foliaceum]MBD2564578.1 hypothetical protein [Nostoc linckia FACHB-391]